MIKFVFDDGGRQLSDFKGVAGDCVARAISIASNKPYSEVYNTLVEGMKNQRRSGKRCVYRYYKLY